MKIAKGEGLRGKFATLDGCEKLLLLCEKNIQTSLQCTRCSRLFCEEAAKVVFVLDSFCGFRTINISLSIINLFTYTEGIPIQTAF